MPDIPTTQPDLSDKGLKHAAWETKRDPDSLFAWVRSVRDQARAAERKRTLLWAADYLDSCAKTAIEYNEKYVSSHLEVIATGLRRAVEEGGR